MKTALFARAAEALATLGGTDGSLSEYFVPGRVELFGKHTDYAGGRSLVCATEQGFCLVARRCEEPVIRAVNGSTGTRAEVALDPALPPVTGDWSVYVAAVARRLTRDFGPLPSGINVAFESDLPASAGLSSSTALTVGLALALADQLELPSRPDWRAAFPALPTLAGYFGAVECGRAHGRFPGDAGVGVRGGSQDHAAILCARSGMIQQFGYEPPFLEREVPFPDGYLLLIAASGVIASKTQGSQTDYNRLSDDVATMLARWNEATGRRDLSLGAAVRSSPDARKRLEALLDEDGLRRRLEQFTTESEELVPAAGDCFVRGDLAGLGVLTDRSQRGAEAGLGNQVAETIHLARSARRLGAAGASAFGAGFGGSVWALVREAVAEDFRERWAGDYRVAFPALARRSRFLLTRAGPSARRI